MGVRGSWTRKQTLGPFPQLSINTQNYLACALTARKLVRVLNKYILGTSSWNFTPINIRRLLVRSLYTLKIKAIHAL